MASQKITRDLTRAAPSLSSLRSKKDISDDGIPSGARRGRRRSSGGPRLQRGRASRRAQQGEERHARPAPRAGELTLGNEAVAAEAEEEEGECL